MTIKKNPMTRHALTFLTLTLLAALAAGCTSSRFGGGGIADDTADGFQEASADEMEQGSPMADDGYADLAVAPDDTTQLTPASVSGVWKASLDDANCQIITPQTKYGQGYRATPRRCPAQLAEVRSWAVRDQKLTFYNGSGKTVALFSFSGNNAFSGRTADGQVATLSR